MHHKSIKDFSTLLQQKKISALELTKIFLARISKFDRELNSFITVNQEIALGQAKEADLLIQKGAQTILTGIPIAHKDNFYTKNLRTTCGSKMLADFIPNQDAAIVEKLAKVGMVTLGKANMDDFAMGSTNENSYFGPVKNPWDLTRVPGGSSGGSAAIVAARMTVAATGSDTGGSARQPAAFCGLCGLKPTFGRISKKGMIAFASTLDQPGIIAKNCEDVALILQFAAGFDANDLTSVDCSVPAYIKQLNNSLAGKTIGLPLEYFSHLCDPEVEILIDEAISEFEKLGAKVKPIHLPHLKYSAAVYYAIAPVEAVSNLEKYGQDAKSRLIGFGKEVRKRILLGSFLEREIKHYSAATKVRRLIKNDFVSSFKEVDIILSPITPSTPFALGEKARNPTPSFFTDFDTIAANLTGLPAISIPIGFNEGLPVGMQLISNYFQEETLLTFGNQYQKVTDWHQKIPLGFE
jgi:aspartyl-tRNA(Asn)/glutamyl-tRNA(Gln) amidotransferase subunit A